MTAFFNSAFLCGSHSVYCCSFFPPTDALFETAFPFLSKHIHSDRRSRKGGGLSAAFDLVSFSCMRFPQCHFWIGCVWPTTHSQFCSGPMLPYFSAVAITGNLWGAFGWDGPPCP